MGNSNPHLAGGLVLAENPLAVGFSRDFRLTVTGALVLGVYPLLRFGIARRRGWHDLINKGATMRMLMNVIFPVEPFNTAVRDGTAGATIKKILETIKPESVYFTEHHGQRGGVLVVDVKEASEIPALAEPWYLAFEADVEFRIAMTAEDLGRANLDALGQSWG